MKLGAVVVTYHPSLHNIELLLSNIIDSVEQVVIVDNGSENISEIKKFISEFNKIELIELGENTGVGYAQNRGIEKLLKDILIEGVVLFDHDSQPEVNMIEKLKSGYAELKKQPESLVGAVGPIYIDPRTGNIYPVVFHQGVSLKKIYPKAGNFKPINTTVLISSGCFIPREILTQIGLMNEKLFIDYIDIEWSFRLQNKGYKLYNISDAFMYHQVGDGRMKVLGREISIHSPVRRYYLARNSMLMLKMPYVKASYKLRESFYTVSRVVVYLLMVKNRRKYLWYILNGWYDGLRGKTGPSKFVQKQKR